MKKFLIGIMFFAGAYGLTFGQQGSTSQSQSQSQSSSMNQKWEKIGEKTVDLKSDHGIFDWNKDREKSINANEKYSAIRFRAKDAPVDLTNVQVQFDNGKKQDLNINTPVKANSDSKILTLENQGELDKITFNYKKDENTSADKAKIEVWGLKSNGSSGMGQRNQEMENNSHSGKSKSSTGDHNKSGSGTETKRQTR
jgi:hypothetical protein